MNFQPHLAQLVLAGAKTVTRRLASSNPRSPWSIDGCGLRVGADYAVCPGRGKHAIGRARVVSVSLMPLGHLDTAEARREGFDSPDAFEAAFAQINGRYDPAALVWRVELELVVPGTPQSCDGVTTPSDSP
ncbi:ASCH domain-containing protein [Catellatospora sp. NPDC049609]|uniref:ASCH domain-containing protein n=1 Tax=Catellatospora sp. NPDC049609 TaxID=3155505 RepID=UPI003424DA22